MRDGMLVGFVPVIEGSEDFDDDQVVDAIVRTDYDKPVATQRRQAPPPAAPLPREGGVFRRFLGGFRGDYAGASARACSAAARSPRVPARRARRCGRRSARSPRSQTAVAPTPGHAEHAAADDRGAHARSRRRPARSGPGRRAGRSSRTASRCRPAGRASRPGSSGARWCSRKMPLIMSAAPASTRNTQRDPDVRREPGQRDRAAPAHRGHDDGPPVVVEPRRSSRWSASRAGCPRSRPCRAGPSVFGWSKHVLGERREQHDRHRHEHRDHVDDVGAEQVAPAHRVADALDDAGHARRGAEVGRRVARAAPRTAGSRSPGRRRRRRRPTATPTVPTSRPPMAGPSRVPICMPSDETATAAGSSSCRTVRGISASRLGRCSDWAIDSRKPMT